MDNHNSHTGKESNNQLKETKEIKLNETAHPHFIEAKGNNEEQLTLNDRLNDNLNSVNDSLPLGELDDTPHYGQGTFQGLAIEKGSSLPKYPFNGKRDKLIDKILFIGYEKHQLNKLFKKELSERNEITTTNFKFKEKPVVLSEISSNYDMRFIDNETIIDLLFPNPPVIFYNQDIQTVEALKVLSYNVVFSFNIPLEGNSKSSKHFSAFVYYDFYQNHCLVPYAICFISEYPYFWNYKAIAIEIKANYYTLMPKEFTFFNLVNFIPAPINSSISVQLFSSKSKHYFQQLSGYPLIEFNLIDLLNSLPVNTIIQILFFSFLENDMLFFSENLEVLNIVMFIFHHLNYPLNDSTYFSHILSVSEETFMEGESPFVTKIFPGMLGINCSYNAKLNTVRNKQEHFVADLEHRMFFYKFNEENPKIRAEAKINIKLLDYLVESLNNRHKDDFLGRTIYELYQALDSISRKVTHRNLGTLGTSWNDFDFFKLTDEKQCEGIRKVNKRIQEHCYTFILKIINLFLHLFKVEVPINNGDVFHINYKQENQTSISSIEQLFYEKFKYSSKFNTFIKHFTQNRDSKDSLEIPFLFANEFIHQIINNPNQHKSFPLNNPFRTIDLFYQVNNFWGFSFNFKEFDNIVSINNTPGILDDLNVLDLVMYKHLHQENKHTHSGKLKEVDQTYFHKYISYLKNLQTQGQGTKLNDLFPCLTKRMINIENFENFKIANENYNIELDRIKRDKKEHLKVTDITREFSSQIHELVEQYSLEQKLLTRNELVFNSFLLLFAITRKVGRDESDDNNILDFIIYLLRFKTKTHSFRKFAKIFVILYYKAIEQKKGENDGKERRALSKIIALIIESNLLLNEELLSYLNKSIRKLYVIVDELSFLIYKDKNYPYKPFSETELTDKAKATENNKSPKSNQSSNEPKNANHLMFNQESDSLRKYSDYFVCLSDNVLYEGDLDINYEESLKENRNKTVWVVTLSEQVFCYTFVFSSLKLYNCCAIMLNAVTQTTNTFKPNYKELKNNLCTLVFYVESIPDLLDLSLENIKGSKEHDHSLNAIESIRNKMLEFLYSILNGLPKEKLEAKRYLKQSHRKKER